MRQYATRTKFSKTSTILNILEPSRTDPQNIEQDSPIISDVCNQECEPLFQHCCSKWLVIPAYLILFGLLQFVYLTNRSVDQFKKNIAPDFVCFNPRRCRALASRVTSIDLIIELTCCNRLNLTSIVEFNDFNETMKKFSLMNEYCLKNGNEQSCEDTSYFHCNQSKKCIPYHRVADGIADCYFHEDKKFNACQLNESKRFKCPSDVNICLPPVAIGNEQPDCPLREDSYIHMNRSCSLEINETDETNCSWWPCNDVYTRCDGFWHCLNGADELSCPNTICSLNEYECKNEHLEITNCLPLTKMPKALPTNYSIRIDLYEKTELVYWTSWYLTIPFQFLPVNRIVTHLFLSEIRETDSCLLPCSKYEDYSGQLRQNRNNQIDMRLNETTISTTSLLLVHLITAFKDAQHERTTVLKKVHARQPFNIVFVQMHNQFYYRIVLRGVFKPLEYIYIQLQQKQRCYSIKDLFNDTFSSYAYLTQTKYYPLVCRQNLQIMCFYDQNLTCICDNDRFSNCFPFNHTSSNDCQGYNQCKNNGQCFQNNETCSTKTICICPDCYYGSQCQFSTESFIFSLDAILGYHIKPMVPLVRQPIIIKISVAIILIMLIFGFISGMLSIVTFCRKKPREVGTGYYRLLSSIAAILTLVTLTIKFWLLIFSHMSVINNRSLLDFNCIVVDVTLKILLSSNEWLNSCVAVERMISTIKGVHFQKSKSKQFSKWAILTVIILIIISYIHDPIHRQLIDDIDIDEHRVWCFLQYSFIIRLHFLTSFSINVTSALWIIIALASNRTDVQTDQSFNQHLRNHIVKH
ncbi:unnamed protein product [Rotaria socialis]|uniref:EGF-like domain-containing protein n=2 Tax=Rotaria socialis TaxID=392032 RepID=A0A820ZER8_9BILA|nr:unnamed protein product [Rotaria socialis]